MPDDVHDYHNRKKWRITKDCIFIKQMVISLAVFSKLVWRRSLQTAIEYSLVNRTLRTAGDSNLRYNFRLYDRLSHHGLVTLKKLISYSIWHYYLILVIAN
jgi:hypothetical protein